MYVKIITINVFICLRYYHIYIVCKHVAKLRESTRSEASILILGENLS